jgi:hypothetical protein
MLRNRRMGEFLPYTNRVQIIAAGGWRCDYQRSRRIDASQQGQSK